MPPRKTRFGSPLVLSRVHWVEPKLVAEITYLTWTADNLLRHTVYVGLSEDKPADQVRREPASSIVREAFGSTSFGGFGVRWVSGQARWRLPRPWDCVSAICAYVRGISPKGRPF